MALTFRSDGICITYQNLGGSTFWGAKDIPSGSIVVDNQLVGVAMSEIVLVGNESGSLSGQRVQDADQDFKFSEGSICRIGEWAYDALIHTDVAAFSKIYWSPDFNILLQDATSSQHISAVSAGAPGWINEGTYGAITVVPDTAVNTTEWFQLKKNEHDAFYSLWGSYSGLIAANVSAATLTGSGYKPAGKGITIAFASITTPVGGDKWEWFTIKGGLTNTDIGAMVLPYVESKVKHLGQETYRIALIQPKSAADTVKAGAYITAKWQDRCRERTPAQGGGQIQTGKILFQFVN
jgi:hypothetical protein